MGYAVSNVCQEASVKKFHLSEFLAFIGLFGSIICGTQSAALEHENIAAIHWTGPLGVYMGIWCMLSRCVCVLMVAAGWFVLFDGCLFGMYTMVPVLLQWSDATMYNLAILTSDVYVLLFGLLLFHYRVC